ncbi:MAG: hypothetical protein ACTHM1_08095 [Solirubrobacteraceae bacterium]
MSQEHRELDEDRAVRLAAQAMGRVLIVEPDEDIRELLVERCRRVGLEPLTGGLDEQGRLPDVDLIVAEPASAKTQAVLAAHRAQRSDTPIVFVSIYPPRERCVEVAGGGVSRAAVLERGLRAGTVEGFVARRRARLIAVGAAPALRRRGCGPADCSPHRADARR